jgi:hypothetical protein
MEHWKNGTVVSDREAVISNRVISGGDGKSGKMEHWKNGMVSKLPCGRFVA